MDEDQFVDEPTLLKALLKVRHWQKRETFSRQWDRVAKTLDSSLVGTCPAHAQFYRWLSGNVRSMPHPDACRILEAMFPGVTVRRLFRPVRVRRCELLEPPRGRLAASNGSATPAAPAPAAPPAFPTTSCGDTAHVEAAHQEVAKRRETIKLGLAVAATPEILHRVLSDAAAEALEFTQLTGLSAVGQGTLDHLELIVSDLNRVYSKNPPVEQFIVARVYPLAVRLHAQAARAHARLGQREPYETLFDEAQRLHERLPARAPSRFTIDTGTLAFYAMTAYPASAYAWLGDFGTARTYGEAALIVHEAAPPASRSPSREAIARLDLATALVHLGAPDGAVALGDQALTSTRVVSSVLLRAGDLDRALVGRYPKLPCVREFHEQYHQVIQSSTITKEGP